MDTIVELEAFIGSPVVTLNRAVAVAENEGAQAGLAILSGLDQAVPNNHRLPAIRAKLARRGPRDRHVRKSVRTDVQCDETGTITSVRDGRSGCAAKLLGYPMNITTSPRQNTGRPPSVLTVPPEVVKSAALRGPQLVHEWTYPLGAHLE